MLKAFHVLPGEERERRLTRRDYLYCILQQWIDDEERLEALCPTCRAQAAEKRCIRCGAPLAQTEAVENTAFDMERYMALKKGECV